MLEHDIFALSGGKSFPCRVTYMKYHGNNYEWWLSLLRILSKAGFTLKEIVKNEGRLKAFKITHYYFNGWGDEGEIIISDSKPFEKVIKAEEKARHQSAVLSNQKEDSFRTKDVPLKNISSEPIKTTWIDKLNEWQWECKKDITLKNIIGSGLMLTNWKH